MGPIQLSALGRDVHVGDLYNYYNDNILPGVTRVLRRNVESNPTCEVDRLFFFQLPHKYKRHVLGINSHLDQSIEGGSVGFKHLWFANYLETQDEDDKTAQVDVIFRIARRTEVFTQQYYDQTNMYEYQLTTGGKATHLVEKVVYGAELIISMRRAIDFEIESKASAEGNIYLAAKTYFQSIQDISPTKNIGKGSPELEKISCNIFSSIQPGNVKNVTFEESCKLLTDALSSTNEDKWKPIEVTLQNIPAQIETRILSEKIKDVEFEKERHLTMLKVILKESDAISKHPSINRVPPLEKAMCQFLDLLASFRNEIENFCLMFFSQSPEQILSDMKPISDLLIDMTEWVMRRRKEIEIMCSLLSDTKLSMADLEEIKSNPCKVKRSRVFILKMDYAQDPLIDRLAKFIGNQEPFKLPVFWIVKNGQYRIEHIIRRLKSFNVLSTVCSSLDSDYQIGLAPFSSSMTDGTVLPIEFSVKDLPEVAATEFPNRPIQPSRNSQEAKLIFSPIKTYLAPTVFNQQQLSTPQRNANNVINFGPIKSVHLPTGEDITAEKYVDGKEPEIEILSIPRDPIPSKAISQDDNYDEHLTGTTSKTSNVRKKSFESIQDGDSMKQASKQRLVAQNQIRTSVIEPNTFIEKTQSTKDHDQYLPDVAKKSTVKEKSQPKTVAVLIKNFTEKSHAERISRPCEASIKPDPLEQKNSSSHQQGSTFIHQQDLKIENQEQSSSKETVGSEAEKKIRRVAEMFAQESNQYAKLIKRGQPNIYLLNAKENLINENFRWFNVDKPDAAFTPKDNRDHKVIILMGATGCGKSTLINGMINYILGVQWSDPFRFKCVRDDETNAKNQAHSQTSAVTAYTLRHHEGMAVPYSITIIDTPGYGDTRGIQRDKKITHQIHQFLTQQETRVEEIHAACFVAASGDSRLTLTQRYIIDSVLSIFGKDVKPNMRLLVTFADNADPPVVEACLAAQFPVTSASAGITYSKFNSSVLYASNEKHGDGDFCIDELFWDMGQENFYKFFIMLEEMNGQNLTSTREVIQRRQQLEQSLKDIETELEGSLSIMEDMEKIHGKLRECSHNMEGNKNFTFEKTVIQNVEVKCDKGFSAYNCKRCKKTCEKPAQITNFEKRICKDGVCICPKNVHVYQQFALLPTLAKIKTTLPDMKAEFESNLKQKLTNEEFMANCMHELNMAKAKVLSLLEQVGVNARSLDSTALRSNSLSPNEYLSLMKSRVLEEQTPGYLTRLQTLTELQKILNAPAVPSTKTDTLKYPETPSHPTNQPGKVSTGSCGRGILMKNMKEINSTGSPGRSESVQSERAETSSRPTQSNLVTSKTPPDGGHYGTASSGNGTDANCKSKIMSETNIKNHGAASTASSSNQTTQETQINKGASRTVSRSQESSSEGNPRRQVGHPPGEPDNYYTVNEKVPKPFQTIVENSQKPDINKSTKTDTLKYSETPSHPTNQPGKVNTGSCGRGRGIFTKNIQEMNFTDSPGRSDSIHYERGESSSRSTQENPGLTEIPPARTAANGTVASCRSKVMRGPNSNVSGAASTVSSNTQTTTQETNISKGAGRGVIRNYSPKSQEYSSDGNPRRQVGHSTGEPDNYYTVNEKVPKPFQTIVENSQKLDTVTSTIQSNASLSVDGNTKPACEPEVISLYSVSVNNEGFSSSEEDEQPNSKQNKARCTVS